MRVPEGWNKQKVGDLFDVQLGKMLNKEAKDKFPQVAYLTNFNVRWGSFVTDEMNTMYFSEKEKEKFLLEHGDLIMCEGGDAGRCAIWREQVKPCYYQKALHRLRTKGKITAEFFQSYMESIAGTKHLDNHATKTSISHLTQEKLLLIRVPVPPLPEQQKIAQILSTWDKAIEKLAALIAAKQKLKKALMQQLLTGKKRFAGFDEDWQKVKLGDICTIESSTSKSEFINESGNQFIIDMGSISREGKLIPSKKTSLSKDYLFIGQLVMPKDDIGGGNIIGRTAYIDKNDKYILGDHVYKLTVIKNNDSLFLSYLINSDFVNKSLRRKANGTAQLGLGKKDVSKQITFLPSEIKEQQKIAAVLSAADREIETQQKHLAALKQQKQGLMQQLLTGKKRVKVEE